MQSPLRASPGVDQLIAPVDLAVVGALAAAGLPGMELHVLHRKVEFLPLAALFGRNGHTQSAHQEEGSFVLTP